MPPEPPLHLAWLADTGEKISTADGRTVDVWEIRSGAETVILSDWAKHLRNHYCADSEIDVFRSGTGLSRGQYLMNIKFPDATIRPGPSIRAGDFGEILATDYLEYILGFWSPRTRYADKTIRNESTKGCDIIGFKFVRDGQELPDDTLAIFESKAQLSPGRAEPKLQNAVDDSIKDQIRKAESLNAIKTRLFRQNRLVEARRVERFQNTEDKPYKEISGAVAVFCLSVYDAVMIAQTDTTRHPNRANLLLLTIRGGGLLELVRELYARAGNEA